MAFTSRKKPAIGDQEASDTGVDGAQDVFQRVAELIESSEPTREQHPLRDCAHRAADAVLPSRGPTKRFTSRPSSAPMTAISWRFGTG